MERDYSQLEKSERRQFIKLVSAGLSGIATPGPKKKGMKTVVGDPELQAVIDKMLRVS